MSDNASGETEAFSESSVETADTEVGFEGRSALSAIRSARLSRSWAGMAGVEAFFLR